MNLSSKRIFLLSVLLILALSLTGWNQAQAHDHEQLNRLLKGDYSFVLRQNCISSPSGFESVIQADGTETFRLLSDARNVGNLARTGTLRFNGDGTGELLIGGNESLSIVAFGHPETKAGGIPFQGIRAGDLACPFAYEVGADRMSFSTESECSTVSPGVIQYLGPLRIRGRFTPNRQMLILSHTKPNVETIEIVCDGCGVAPDGTVLFTIDRVCNRSGTAIKTRRHRREDTERDD